MTSPKISPSPSAYDVVVVGARPAGAATAMLLARAGLRVLVVDRAATARRPLDPCPVARRRPAAGPLGAAATGSPPRGRPVRTDRLPLRRRAVDVPIKPGDGFDALYAPRRTVLDPILVDAARRGRRRRTLRGQCDRPVPRRHRARHGNRRPRPRRKRGFTARARMTVGADGMSSKVARLVGAPVERSATNAAAAIYGYWDGPADGYELFYRPGVTGGVFPTNDGQDVSSSACPRSGCEPSPAGRGRSSTVGSSTRWRQGGSTRRPVRRRGSGCGSSRGGPATCAEPADRAGHWSATPATSRTRSPSHGLTDALRDAELLARALLAAAAQRVPEAPALASYQATRDRLSARLFATTDAIASLLGPATRSRGCCGSSARRWPTR